MEFINNISKLHVQNKTAVTLGKFDGLHRGHRKLISEVISKKVEGYLPSVFTFETPPSKYLTGSTEGVLLSNLERCHYLHTLGIEILVQCPFTKEIASLEAEIFVKEILIEKFNAGCIVVGDDFRFGHNRTGDVYVLKELSKKYGFELIVFSKEQEEGRDISSTYIKEELKKGNIEVVNRLLGYSYFISGEIIHGKKLGRQLGVPTINITPEAEKLLPPNGVYPSISTIEGRKFYGTTNIGSRPTVSDSVKRNIETYLMDFDKDVYGKEAIVELCVFQRSEEKFDSLEELQQQMELDIQYARKYFQSFVDKNTQY
ncbi:MAG: bifunctional riboflavin kinase/FAD synthetase [Clostridiales bacterium]|mgnify:CR=1 FL=1|nr:bifunctional riboflavin kinase/FAD synthetase [Clostridiales bacterium]